ncbi:hypothetical protein M8818_000066 [Zalaria obscura]|uniref:Uncharacterized protein n=1 Tax=Zalaria obscura TaxID=2024903 RepID=A0ACC3SNJ4_9PEZI
MLRTLRQGGKERTSSGKLATSLRSKPPAAAKAATQAWGTTQRGSLGSIEQALGDSNGGSSTAAATAWDPYTRTLVERPPSRDRPTSRDDLRLNPMTRSTSDLPVRTATPSDLNRKQDDTHAERGRQYDRSPPYPDFPVMSPPQLSNPFERSSEDLQASGIPDPKSSPPRVPLHAEPASSKTKLRKQSPARLKKPELPSYRKEYPPAPPSKYKKPPNAAPPRQFTREPPAEASASSAPFAQPSNPKMPPKIPRKAVGVVSATAERQRLDNAAILAGHSTEETLSSEAESAPRRRTRKAKEAPPQPATPPSSDDANDSDSPEPATPSDEWQKKVEHLMKHLPKGVDEAAAKQIFNEIVIQGDEVHWSDVAGLDIAKSALKETVVYPFLRPDLFMGLREPARGMLLFGPPGTGKTMLARAVATESRSTFFAISASSLTSKYLGESEKLVRALFAIAKALAPSIIFVDEIDSLLSARGGGSEHEATRRIKTEFLIQWSDLAKAAAGRETSERDKERGDASRVLVLAATNLPWAIDEAARRRFVRRQYIPLPEDWVRKQQLATLLSHQKHELGERELDELVVLTEGFSGSDITALAKDAAMGPLRSLGEKLLDMSPEDIRPIRVADFRASLVNIRPSVSKAGLKEFEDWAKEFGERGG